MMLKNQFDNRLRYIVYPDDIPRPWPSSGDDDDAGILFIPRIHYAM